MDDYDAILEGSSLYNPTVWRYGATQLAQNKEVTNMIIKNSEKKKKIHINRLNLPEVSYPILTV